MRAVLKDALLPVSFSEFLKLALPGGIMMQVCMRPSTTSCRVPHTWHGCCAGVPLPGYSLGGSEGCCGMRRSRGTAMTSPMCSRACWVRLVLWLLLSMHGQRASQVLREDWREAPPACGWIDAQARLRWMRTM